MSAHIDGDVMCHDGARGGDGNTDGLRWKTFVGNLRDGSGF